MTNESIKKSLSGFLPNEVLDALLTGRSAELARGKREVTISFSELAGIDAIASTMDPAEFIRLMNACMSAADESIRTNNGTLEDIVNGASVRAMWNAPYAVADHEVRACCAAIDWMRSVGSLCKKANLESPLAVRIGINSGTVFAGVQQFGEWRRYTAVGDEVNLAARLEGANKFFGTTIMVSESTWLRVSGLVEGRPIGKIRLRDYKTEVSVFEVLERKGHLSEKSMRALEQYDEALDLFQHAKYQDSIAGFQQLLTESPDDQLSRFYRNIAEEQSKMPSRDWDGIFNLAS
jgi:adenylate cyclase